MRKDMKVLVMMGWSDHIEHLQLGQWAFLNAAFQLTAACHRTCQNMGLAQLLAIVILAPGAIDSDAKSKDEFHVGVPA